MVRLLLGSRADANAVGSNGDSALAVAASASKLEAESGEIAALLVGYGADVDYGGTSRADLSSSRLPGAMPMLCRSFWMQVLR